MPSTKRIVKGRHRLVRSKKKTKVFYGVGKWSKHRFLMRPTDLRPALPHTQLMNKQSFYQFLMRYRSIVVKPSNGSGGTGVMKVTSLGNNRYEVRYGTRRKTLLGWRTAYHFVRRLAKGTYIVQQKINLATINGQPFDVRVMLQRNKKRQWVITGILAKIAGPGHFITNIVRSRGRALPLSTAIKRSNVSGVSPQHILNQINRISLKAVHCLQRYYSLRIVGLDIGIDRNGKVWIIEANFSPDKTYFLRLKDKTMYRRIMAYYRMR